MVILTPLIERIIRFHQSSSPNEWQIEAIKSNNQHNLTVTIAQIDTQQQKTIGRTQIVIIFGKILKISPPIVFVKIIQLTLDFRVRIRF